MLAACRPFTAPPRVRTPDPGGFMVRPSWLLRSPVGSLHGQQPPLHTPSNAWVGMGGRSSDLISGFYNFLLIIAYYNGCYILPNHLFGSSENASSFPSWWYPHRDPCHRSCQWWSYVCLHFDPVRLWLKWNLLPFMVKAFILDMLLVWFRKQTFFCLHKIFN